MGRKATTLTQQIELLQSRGMSIVDTEKAKEVLLDVGYYRLGFYWFPFEETYPRLENRTHDFIDGTSFEDVVRLYYFDVDLRNILHKILSRIEIAVRTKLVYFVSNAYPNQPIWFADPSIVSKSQAINFEHKVYDAKFRRIPEIGRHHSTYINDKFAPAWKTIEHMTLGAMLTLYSSLQSEDLKIKIAKEFGVNFPAVFENYMETVRQVRNVCAHGRVLFDFAPQKQIRKGPAIYKGVGKSQNLCGALKVILYLLKEISKNRYDEYRQEILGLVSEAERIPAIKRIMSEISGFSRQ